MWWKKFLKISSQMYRNIKIILQSNLVQNWIPYFVKGTAVTEVDIKHLKKIDSHMAIMVLYHSSFFKFKIYNSLERLEKSNAVKIKLKYQMNIKRMTRSTMVLNIKNYSCHYIKCCIYHLFNSFIIQSTQLAQNFLFIFLSYCLYLGQNDLIWISDL